MAEMRHKLLPTDLQSRMNTHDAKMPSDKSLKMSSAEKISNKHYEADVSHALQYTRGFCTLLGVWSMVSRNPTTLQKMASKLLIPACMLSSAFILTPPICYLLFNEETMMEQLFIITPFSYFIGTFIKYVFIILRCNMIKFCIEHVRTDWMTIDSEEGRAIMKTHIKVGHKITVICSGFLYTCGFFLHTGMPLLSPRVLNEFNVTVRPLAYPGYDHFYNSQTSPNYEITFFTICISIFVGYNVSNAVCNFAAIFVTHTCGQIQILISRIGRLNDEFNESDKNDSINERVTFIVRSHVRALRFASNIQTILTEICFIELLASMIIICLAEYCFVMQMKNMDAWKIFTYSLCLISLICNVYVYCHIGELLKEQFHNIGEAAYMVKWYKFPSKVAIDIIMIMVMASCPRLITAGNMIELSMSNFANVMKMSITYCNMLRQLTD